MRSVALLLALGALLGSAACRPSGDRVDATESGAVATGGAVASRKSGDPVAKGAEKATPETLPDNLAIAAEEPEPEDSATNLPANEVVSNTPATAPAPTIPARYRGRWGMVPADCTSTRGDAKGLIRIDERTIRFYESTATLQNRLPGAATSFAGNFSFTGEGMSWKKAMTLMVRDDTLTRTENGQSFTYTRCA